MGGRGPKAQGGGRGGGLQAALGARPTSGGTRIFLLNSEVSSLEKVGEFRLNPGSRTEFANLPDVA